MQQQKNPAILRFNELVEKHISDINKTNELKWMDPDLKKIFSFTMKRLTTAACKRRTPISLSVEVIQKRQIMVDVEMSDSLNLSLKFANNVIVLNHKHYGIIGEERMFNTTDGVINEIVFLCR